MALSLAAILHMQSHGRLRLQSKLKDDPTTLDFEQAAEDLASVLQELNRLERYERRTVSRRNRALQQL